MTEQVDISQHLDALREAGAVVICWTSEDMPGATPDERQAQLDSVAKSLEERSIERGWEVVETLLGVSMDDEEEDDE